MHTDRFVVHLALQRFACVAGTALDTRLHGIILTVMSDNFPPKQFHQNAKDFILKKTFFLAYYKTHVLLQFFRNPKQSKYKGNKSFKK